MRAIVVAALGFALLFGASGLVGAQDRPAVPGWVTPDQPVGRKTDRGVSVSSASDGFQIELSGRQMRPLSDNRLLWDVDGLQVELLVLRRPWQLEWSARRATRELETAIGAREIETLDAPADQPRHISATATETVGSAPIPAGLLIVKVGGNVPPGDPAARRYIRQSLSTLQAADATLRREALPASSQTGATVQDQLRLHESLVGEPYIALLNDKLAMPLDRALPDALALDPPSIADFARWLFGLGIKAFAVNVFDGRVSHGITLVNYDFATESFVYLDPWGQGSFLEKANNAAGIGVKPHATLARHWLVSFAELENVLYAVIGSRRTLFDALRLCTLANAPAQTVFDTYLELTNAGTDTVTKPVKAEDLDSAARALFRVDRPSAATALMAVRSTLGAASLPAPADLALLARRSGVSDPAALAVTLRRGALTGVRPSPALTRDAALASEFFRFFNLRQVQADATRASFRSAGQFMQRAEVILHFEGNGRVTTRELAIRRSFIADPVAGVFAADFTKSFIAFAVAPSDRAAVQPLVDEIYGRRAPRVAIPGAFRSGTSVPATPSNGAMAFRGARPSFDMTLPSSMLQMRHEGASEAVDLRVIVEPR